MPVKAKERRQAKRQQRADEAGGEPDYPDGTPRDRRRQNRAFADATKNLTIEEADRLHREISGEGVDFQELRRRADEIVLGRKK
jgi:hypothetical protein